MSSRDPRQENMSADRETTFVYNQDVECVMERIDEWFNVSCEEDNLECCAAEIVDQLFWRWFGQEHYEIQQIRAVGGGAEAAEDQIPHREP